MYKRQASDFFIEIQKKTIIERTKLNIFLKNIELTLFLELIMTTYRIQIFFISRKCKIKKFVKIFVD